MVKMPDNRPQAFFLLSIFLLIVQCCFAQQPVQDTIIPINADTALVHRDARMDRLGEEMAEYNTSLAQKVKMVNGFRLMLISTTDRAQVMKIRTTILQVYPDQKLYLSFIAPYLKLKMGNFLTRKEAEDMRKTLLDLKIVTGNVYIVPEQVELKPEKPVITP